MIAPGIPIEEINKSHLKDLIARSMAEGRTVEYKRDLPSGTDESKKEFLADVSSFANANGGDLIFGIEAKHGVPTRLAPLKIAPDSELPRWEQTIRDGIKPHIPGIRVHAIPVEGGHVLLIRVPKSWIGPHVVSFKNWSRFFSRTSAGKCQLDVDELRSAFLASTTLRDQIRTFRAERLSLIIGGDAPIPLADNPKLVVHLIPFEAFTTQPVLGLTAHEGSGLFRPIFQKSGGTGTRWNIDGLLTYNTDTKGERITVYSQLFRNGIFEGVDARTLQPKRDQEYGGPSIYAYWVEESLNTGLANPLEVLRRIGVQPPVVIFVTIVGARNYLVLSSGAPLRDSLSEWCRIDRDVLYLPDVFVETFDIDYTQDLPRLLRPVVDAFWQAGGWRGSPNYDGAGNWKEKP